jgi:membrane protein implicated in regulation of membrane protease activity
MCTISRDDVLLHADFALAGVFLFFVFLVTFAYLLSSHGNRVSVLYIVVHGVAFLISTVQSMTLYHSTFQKKNVY